MRTRVVSKRIQGNLIFKVAVQSPPGLYKGGYRPWLVMEFLGVSDNHKRHTWGKEKIMRAYGEKHRFYEACGYFDGILDLPKNRELTWVDLCKLTVMTDIQSFLPQFYSWHDYTDFPSE